MLFYEYVCVTPLLLKDCGDLAKRSCFGNVLLLNCEHELFAERQIPGLQHTAGSAGERLDPRGHRAGRGRAEARVRAVVETGTGHHATLSVHGLDVASRWHLAAGRHQAAQRDWSKEEASVRERVLSKRVHNADVFDFNSYDGALDTRLG